MNGAERWLKFAQEDLTVARLSLEKKVYNQACFHSHQGVEKILKGYLLAKGEDVPRTHSITALLKLCAKIDSVFNELPKDARNLDDYYIPTRYPDALPGTLPEGLPGQDDAEKAISILEKIMKFIAEMK